MTFAKCLSQRETYRYLNNVVKSTASYSLTFFHESNGPRPMQRCSQQLQRYKSTNTANIMPCTTKRPGHLGKARRKGIREPSSKKRNYASQGMNPPGVSLVSRCYSVVWVPKWHGKGCFPEIHCSRLENVLTYWMQTTPTTVLTNSKTCRQRVWRSEIEAVLHHGDPASQNLQTRQQTRDRCRCPPQSRPDDEYASCTLDVCSKTNELATGTSA